MGRRGRPPKTKVAPRRTSVSGSDRSSSSPERYLFKSSTPTVVDAGSHTPNPGAIGLSWVNVLKGNSQAGMATASKLVVSPPVDPVVRPDDAPPHITPCPPHVRKIAKIAKSDIESEIEYWELSVVCYVTSANPPLQVVDGFARRI